MAKVNYAKAPPTTVLIADIPKNQSPKQLVAFYQNLFPDFKEDQMDAITSLGIRAISYNGSRALYKKFVWNRSSSSPNFNDRIMSLLLDEVQKKNIAQGHTHAAALDITRDWSLSKVPNADLWRAVRAQGANGFSFEAPRFKEGDGFSLKVYPVVVNPDNETEVWGMGASFEKERLFSERSVDKKEWERLYADAQKHVPSFDVSDMSRLLKPKLRFLWSLEAPDGEQSGQPMRHPLENWSAHPSAVAWTKARNEEIDNAYQVISRYAALVFLSETLGEESPFRLIPPSEQAWDFVDSPELVSWKDLSLFLETAPLARRDQLQDVFLSEVINLPFSKRGLAKNAWKDLATIRTKVSEISWVSDDQIVQLVKKERLSFIESFNDGISSKLDGLTGKEKNILLDLLYWNDCNIPSLVQNVLMGVEEDVVIVPENPVAQKITENKNSSTDWKPLLAAFNVDQDAERSGEFKVHPFENWMSRLLPPKNVEDTTKIWIEENDVFNNVNRMILRKKDSEDVAMNTELVTKLKSVIETSNKVMEESNKSGGWWGRVRKNMGSSGTTSEQWADVYIDFQDHLRSMFEEINTQLERDKVWLDYADKIKMSADKTSEAWQGWLVDVAKDLEQERESAPDDKGSITSEQKIEWTNKVGILDSAQSALEHINTATSISSVLLEKVRQSVTIKEKLQQRTMMFYWSSLNLFAGLQSLQRTTSHIGDQAQLVEEMAAAFQSTLKYSLKEEMEQKEKIRDAFKHMALSEDGMKEFYKTLASFQKDTVAIMGDLSASRQQMQEETAEVAQISSASVNVKKKQKEMTASDELAPPSSKPARTI